MQLLLLLQRHLSSCVGTFVDIKTVSDFLLETSSPSISFSFSFSFSFQEPCWFQRTEPIPGNVHGSKCSFFSGRKNLSLASCCLFRSVWCSLGRGRFGKLRCSETVTKNSDFEWSGITGRDLALAGDKPKVIRIMLCTQEKLKNAGCIEGCDEGVITTMQQFSGSTCGWWFYNSKFWDRSILWGLDISK